MKCWAQNGFKLHCDLQTLWNASISPSEAKGSDTWPISASGQQLLAQLLCGFLCPAVQGRPQALGTSRCAVAHPELPQKLMEIHSSQTFFFFFWGHWVDASSIVWLWLKLNKLWHFRERAWQFSQKYSISLSFYFPPLNGRYHVTEIFKSKGKASIPSLRPHSSFDVGDKVLDAEFETHCLKGQVRAVQQRLC